jgi:two-component system, OmpR family, sensor histidine kinase KdpD
MTDERPNADALLARVQEEEGRQTRGKLKVFFGAAPGVGKTYAMLQAARKTVAEGRDIVIGYVEPHSRPDTQALTLGLSALPCREVMYRGKQLLEFDLDAALARHPEIIVVDELAHTNAPGVTHAKRWQDVVRLLDAGIDVYTTLNVQHLESQSDIVAHISGIAIRETVPDSVFNEADEVELVDISPEGLIERLHEGKVYVSQQAMRAVENYFNKGNLIALRELALRRTAERVGAQMEDYRQVHAISRTWAARDRLLVCVGASPFSVRLVRATYRMASSLKVPWVAAHVETLATEQMPEAARARLSQTLHLAEQLGAEIITLSGKNVSDELILYSRTRNVTKIIVGKPMQPRWKEWLRGSLVYELTRKCGDIDVYVISGEPDSAEASVVRTVPRGPKLMGYIWTLIAVTSCTIVGSVLFPVFAPTNLAMLYLLGVLLIAWGFGRGPSILASFLGVAAFDFFFVPPYLTFAVHDTQYFVTFLVMLITGVMISTLTAQVKFQADSARRREQRTAALYAVGRELAATRNREEIAKRAAALVSGGCNGQVAVLLPDKKGHLIAYSGAQHQFELPLHDEGVAQWVYASRETAGKGTATLPGSRGLYFPLAALSGTVGVLAYLPREEEKTLNLEHVHLFDAFAQLIALTIERANLAEEAERIGLQMEAERLRSALLSTVSHDLRTPLAAITGASSTLLDDEEKIDQRTRRELLESIFREAGQLHHLVTNLLEMTRLQAGALDLRKEWQPVEEVVGAALGRMARQLKSHAVATKISPDLPFVALDELLIQQVIINLLENAAKYAPPGSQIEIKAQAENSSVVIEVANQGPALANEDLDRVFEEFYRSANPSVKPGAGLGLAICRGIVELHGGKIWAANRPAGGVSFFFSLPVTGSPPEVSFHESEG